MAERKVPGSGKRYPEEFNQQAPAAVQPGSPQEATDECWVTGIPYIRTHEGWL